MCPNTRTEGLTFAEVLVCVYILAVALLGLMATRCYCVQAQRGGQERQIASRLAEDMLTELSVSMRESSDNFRASHRIPRTLADQSRRFEYAVSESSLGPDFKQLDLCIYYSEEGVSREFALSAWIYNLAR